MAGGLRAGIGFLHLSEDFGFADHLRIESGGDGEEVRDGGGALALHGVGGEDRRLDGLDAAERGGEAGAGGGIAGDSVDLEPVARGQDAVLAHCGVGAQFGGEGGVSGRSEREALADLEWRGLVADSEEEKMRRPAAHGVGSAAEGAMAAGGMGLAAQLTAALGDPARIEQTQRQAEQLRSLLSQPAAGSVGEWLAGHLG